MTSIEKISDDLSFLEMLQRNEVRAGLTLTESSVIFSYIGRILQVHGAGLESWVSISVDHAAAIFTTQASLDRSAAFNALRDAREAVTPSADIYTMAAADMDLTMTLGAEYDETDNSIVLTSEENRPGQFLLRSITHIIGVQSNL